MKRFTRASQMVAYGKHLLFTGEILDLEGRIKAIGSMKKEDCEGVLALHFKQKPAAAAVGKRTSPLIV